jgi:hypothetical protein
LVRTKFGINFDNTQSDFADWITYFINTLKEEDLNYIAAVTYDIWYAHNQQVFEHKDMEYMEVIDKAITNIQDYQLATNIENHNQRLTQLVLRDGAGLRKVSLK